MKITVGSRTLLAKNCPKCGHWRQGSDFSSHIDKRTKKLKRSGYCRKCHVEAASESNRRHREKIRAEAIRNGLPWGAEELKQVYALIDLGWSHAQIAVEMRRPLQGIEHALQRYPRKS